jgi:squalene-hopene/tetraprenyl-beta-curcumene cyclase
MKKLVPRICFAAVAIAAVAGAAEPVSMPAPTGSVPGVSSYNGKAAGEYLDSRLTWWTTWPTAARDQGTFCVSCHTALPYAMSRPALRKTLAETGPSPIEEKLLANVTKRVRMWQEAKPFYPTETVGADKTPQSRGTESILDALVLTNYDVASVKLSPDARLALNNMWAEQLKTGDDKGAWAWLQFHNAPFEGDSQYYGSAMAAVAVGLAPGNYRSEPEIQDGLNSLRGYLVSHRASQTLLDRVILLWASAKIPGLLTPTESDAIITEALSKQQADGGFSLSNFVGTWKRRDNTPLDARSDGYATGLVTYVLQQTGMKRDQPSLRRGLAWLSGNQDPSEGRWLSYSLNKQRDLTSDVGRFMSDAATAYAVLSLEQSR